MSEQSGRVVRIERTFAASAENLFDAWPFEAHRAG